MGKEREKLFGKFGICHCGSCEAVEMRAVEIVGKMMLDGECSQYAVALGVAVAAVASISLGNSTEAEVVSKLGILGAIFANDATAYICDDISETMKEWMDGPGYEIVTAELSKHIEKANEQTLAEQNLPKGD